jgi:tetratricopeptide (TPR) repeat protein
MAISEGGQRFGETDSQRFVETVLARLKPIEKFAKWFYIFLLTVIVLVGIAMGTGTSDCKVACPFSAKIVLTWGVSLTVAGASTAVGCLLGFLFGIPRSLQQRNVPPANTGQTAQQPSDADKSPLTGTQAFRSNTSLEEISDWLTKIIIGVGLVQFQTFIAYLYKASLLASAFVAGDSVQIATEADLLSYDSGLSSPYFFALIIATLIAGCMFAYLETRTRLTLLFVSAEFAAKEGVDEKLVESAQRPVVTGTGDGRSPSAPVPATEADKDIAKLGREKLTDPKQLVGWASAQARLGNYDAAESALRDALKEDPDSNDIRNRIADVQRLRGNYPGYFSMINEVIERTTDRAARIALQKRALLSALYVPPPRGYQQAIALSDKLIAESAADADVYLWRAAAFGQYSNELDKGADTEEQKEVRAKALEAVKKVVELSPDYNSSARRILRQMFDPTGEHSSQDDNDLVSLNDDPEFKDAVYAGKPAEK